MDNQVFHAIADPTRRAIIDLLATESRSVSALAENFEISRPAISKHLKVLRECDLVVAKRDGRRRLYRAKPQRLEDAAAWMLKYHAFWETRLDALEAGLRDESERRP